MTAKKQSVQTALQIISTWSAGLHLCTPVSETAASGKPDALLAGELLHAAEYFSGQGWCTNHCAINVP